MADTLTITLPRDFLGQIIDGLDVLIEDWRATAIWLETGDSGNGVVIRECSSSREAEKLANYYARIRDHLESQL